MARQVLVDQQDRVAILRLDSGAGHALTRDQRAELLLLLDQCAADAGVDGLVLTGPPSGGVFSTGLPLGELEAPPLDPSLMTLCNRLADYPKPVVAALQGPVLGGALDLILAAHGRVARRDCHIGSINTPLGLLPRGGATQRLPALLGARGALTLLRGDRMYDIANPMLQDLCNQCLDEDPEDAAAALARHWASDPAAWQAARERQPGFADAAAFQREILALREEDIPARPPSDRRLIDCVEASLLLPLPAGLEFEAAAAEDCRTAPETLGLLHAQRARRNAAHFPDRAAGAVAEISVLGLVGGGSTALAMALLAARRGMSVRVFERHAEAVQLAQQQMQAMVTRRAGRGDRDSLLGRIEITTHLGALAEADMVIETVAENLDTKKQIFAALDLVLGEDAIRVTQSGLLSIDEIAASSKYPQRVTGVHFQQPLLSRDLVELIPGSATDSDTLSTTAGFAAALGRIALRCGTLGGSLGEPMLAALREVGWYYILQGVSPYEVDRILTDFGLPDGIFGALDRQGLDVALHRLELLFNRASYPGSFATLLRLMLDQGRRGQRTGLGFYQWDAQGRPSPDPALSDVLNEGQPWHPPVSEAEVRTVTLAALANQGARLLRSEAAVRPSDIDAVMVLGQGWQGRTGGPMKAAQMCGMFRILQELKARAGEMPELFDPEPGIAALVKNGETFDDLNRLGRQRRFLPL